MIHEFKLIFQRDAESGEPYLVQNDPVSGNSLKVDLEGLILEATRDSDTGLPVLVRFDDLRENIDLEKVFRSSKARNLRKKDVFLIDGMGRRADVFKMSSNAIYPYVLMVETDDGPMPAAFSCDGTCATGRTQDSISRVCYEDIRQDMQVEARPDENEVDESEFPCDIPDNLTFE